MAKIYGSTVATPIKPDVFVNNKPTIYEGTIINSFDASTTGGIFNKGVYAFLGNTVSEFWLNLKVGDLYYNTDEKKTYLCLSVSVDDNKAKADATWKDLNVKPDEVYNPESANAQSGVAVAQALKTVNVDLSNYYTKQEIDDNIGNIETALDSIIAIQNSLIGGDA